MQNRFKDPADASTYTWHVNHREEEKRLESQYTWSSSTGGSPLPQFGGRKPEVWTMRGTILHRAQHDAFETWLALGDEHTIYFRDCDGVEFEAMILSYAPQKIAGLNKNDPVNMPRFYYRYELQLLVLGEVA